MQLNDVLDNAADQNKGLNLDLVNPFTGEKTGMTFRIVGPDSATARRARLELADELAEVADTDGVVKAEDRERARLNCLAKLVIDWTVNEDDDKPVPFNTRNVLILLRVLWVHEQVDSFAGDRRNFAGDR